MNQRDREALVVFVGLVLLFESLVIFGYSYLIGSWGMSMAEFEEVPKWPGLLWLIPHVIVGIAVGVSGVALILFRNNAMRLPRWSRVATLAQLLLAGLAAYEFFPLDEPGDWEFWLAMLLPIFLVASLAWRIGQAPYESIRAH